MSTSVDEPIAQTTIPTNANGGAVPAATATPTAAPAPLTTALTAPTPGLLDKFVKLDRELNNELVEKANEIHAMQVALLSRQHLFQLGEPGIAKTLTITRLVKRIEGAEFFDVLMGKFLTPEAIFGPVSMKGLANDEFKRRVEGTALTANVTHFDELWDANQALLKDLNWYLNERRYRNDTIILDLPLATMLCSSNRLPENEGLGAVADRIPIWLHCKKVQDRGNVVRMYKIKRDGLLVGDPTPVMTWDDVLAAQAEVRRVFIPDAVLEKLAEVVFKLETMEIVPSPRRQLWVQDIIQAVAWLDGSGQAEVEHLGFLANCFWQQPEEIAKVEGVVLELSNPMQKKALDMLASVDGLGIEIENIIAKKRQDASADVTGEAYQIQQKLARADKDLNGLEKDAGTSRRQKETVGRCRERLSNAGERLLKEVFELTPDQIASLLARQSK